MTGIDRLRRARPAVTVRRVNVAGLLVLAFAVPFAASAARGEPAPSPAAVLEPPVQGSAPAAPRLGAAAPLPAPPAVPVRRRARRATVAAPARAPTVPAPRAPEPTVVAPAPAAAPAPSRPPRKTFDLKG